MKKYNFINNSLGWLCFVIAAVTYLLTLEPTASFWDCPEFISQGMNSKWDTHPAILYGCSLLVSLSTLQVEMYRWQH